MEAPPSWAPPTSCPGPKRRRIGRGRGRGGLTGLGPLGTPKCPNFSRRFWSQVHVTPHLPEGARLASRAPACEMVRRGRAPTFASRPQRSVRILCDELMTMQGVYKDGSVRWPPSLEASATVDALRSICELDLSKPDSVEPPRGFRGATEITQTTNRARSPRGSLLHAIPLAPIPRRMSA